MPSDGPTVHQRLLPQENTKPALRLRRLLPEWHHPHGQSAATHRTLGAPSMTPSRRCAALPSS
eukprot:3165485-Alexandrium_andersonii.AAC.1